MVTLELWLTTDERDQSFQDICNMLVHSNSYRAILLDHANSCYMMVNVKKNFSLFLGFYPNHGSIRPINPPWHCGAPHRASVLAESVTHRKWVVTPAERRPVGYDLSLLLLLKPKTIQRWERLRERDPPELFTLPLCLLPPLLVTGRRHHLQTHVQIAVLFTSSIRIKCKLHVLPAVHLQWYHQTNTFSMVPSRLSAFLEQIK